MASWSAWVVFAGGGHLLVQAAQHMLAAVRQRMPGVGVGDQQQVPGGLDGLGDLRRGVPGGGPRQVRGRDVDQLPVAQQAQVPVQAGERRGGAGLAGAGAAGEHQVLPGWPPDRDAGLAAGLLGAQHGDQRGKLPGDRFEAGKRGQLTQAGGGV